MFDNPLSYLAYIFQEYMGYSQNLSLILASVAFTQYAIFSWPPYFYIDKIGRRWSIMLSSAGCAICMAIVAGCLAVRTYSNAAAAVAFMFVRDFSLHYVLNLLLIMP